MNTSIKVTLSEKMLKDAKKLVAEGKYASVSALVRSGIRRVFYDADKITENDFPGWFEDQILEDEEFSKGKEIVLETEEDVHNYFLHLKLPKKQKRAAKVYVKDKTRPWL